MSKELGRLSAEQMAKPILADAPEKQVAAMLTKLDEMSDKMNAILVAVDAATDGDTLYAALAAAGLISVEKIDLTL